MSLRIIRCNIDSAGNGLIGKIPIQPFCFVENNNIAIISENVDIHGTFPNIHSNAIMVEGSLSVFVNNIGICRVGDKASCGHQAGPGSSFVFSI